MRHKTIAFLWLLVLLTSCISAPELKPAKEPIKPVVVTPGNVVFYTAFKEFNLKFESSTAKLVQEETEIRVSAPEGVVLAFFLKNKTTGKNVQTVYVTQEGTLWKANMIFQENGEYELSVLVKKDANNYYGAALVTLIPQVPEGSSLFAFKSNGTDQWVRIKDVKEIFEQWNPGELNFYGTYYSKYRTGKLLKDTVFTFNNQTFSLAADTEIRFSSGDAGSKYLAFSPASALGLTVGAYTVQYKPGALFYVDTNTIIGAVAGDFALDLTGAALDCPADSVIAFRDNKVLGVQLSKNAEIVIRKIPYTCTDYVYVSSSEEKTELWIYLAKDTPLKQGNTKLVCPALSSVTFSENGITYIYLSKDATVTVDGKNQEIKTHFAIYFDDKGNFREAILEEGC